MFRTPQPPVRRLRVSLNREAVTSVKRIIKPSFEQSLTCCKGSNLNGMRKSLRFRPSWLRYIAPDKSASLTAVVRYDFIDIDGDEAEAIEPGIALRPTADTVFKFSYRFSQDSLGVRGFPGRLFDDEGFIFSLATYF